MNWIFPSLERLGCIDRKDSTIWGMDNVSPKSDPSG